MEKFYKSLGLSIAFCALLIIAAPLCCGIGALTGITTSWFFGDIIRETLMQAGYKSLAMLPIWKVGGTLGFFSAFLRTRITVGKE